MGNGGGGSSLEGGLRLTTHLLLVPRLRMGGAMPSLLLYAFMPCAGTTLRFFLLLDETLSPADLLGTYFES
jgi:hypothetical protein